MIEIADMKTPIGDVRIAARDGKLWGLSPLKHWGKIADGIAERSNGDLRGAKDPAGTVSALTRYFDGELEALDEIPVELSANGFRRRAWESMREIPAGETISYAELAERAGYPGAARAAGSACGSNLVGIVIPCHRVVRSDGSLGGYGWGLERKQWLLRHEGALDRRLGELSVHR